MAVPQLFSVDRESQTTLTEQVVHGLVQAIRCGRLKPGERLPSMMDLAAGLAVSEIVVRRAIRQLKVQGELVSRRGSGVRVAQNRRPPWIYHVLYLYLSDTYFFTRVRRELEDRCEDAGIRLTPVFLNEREYRRGLPNVMAVLDGAPVDLVVTGGGSRSIEEQVRLRGLPLVTLGETDLPDVACSQVGLNRLPALAALAAHARGCGVRRAVVVRTRGQHRDGPELAAFAAAGIACEVLGYTASSDGDGTPQWVEMEGRQATEQLLQRPGALPDLIYYTDDYAARGGMYLLAERGVRVPQDLQLALSVNSGHVPSFSCPLTRIEVDPAAFADTIYQNLRQVLQATPEAPTRTAWDALFIPGGSTRAVPSPSAQEPART